MIVMTIENQPELFEYLDNQKQKRYKKPKLFTRKKIHILLSYENIVLFGIVFLMVLVLIFSLGVERGKRINIAKRDSVNQTIEEKYKDAISTEEDVTVGKDSLNLKKPEDKKVELTAFYTIQVITYKEGPMVEKEMQRLREKGYHPFVIPHGNLRQICVGKFESRSLAEKALIRLRRRYKDCFIRRIK